MLFPLAPFNLHRKVKRTGVIQDYIRNWIDGNGHWLSFRVHLKPGIYTFPY